MFARVNNALQPRPSILTAFGSDGALAARLASSWFEYKKDTEIYEEDEAAEYVYEVITGAVRSYKLLSDGRRQIGAFHLPGDIFGLENGSAHRFTAEAIVDTSVQLVRRF